MEDFVVGFGSEVKALNDKGLVGGYAVLFTGERDPDLGGQFFTRETDFGPHVKSSVYYHHGLDRTLGLRTFAEAELKKVDEVGAWVEAQLALRDRYEEAVFALAKAGKLGWSTGTAAHLVEYAPKGKATWIKRWPLGLDTSLTPTPMEPRTSALALKSLAAAPFADLAALLGIAGAPAMKAESYNERIRRISEAWHASIGLVASAQKVETWVSDVFDDAVVAYYGNGYYRVPYEEKAGGVEFAATSSWVAVVSRREWVAKKAVYEAIIAASGTPGAAAHGAGREAGGEPAKAEAVRADGVKGAATEGAAQPAPAGVDDTELLLEELVIELLLAEEAK